MGSTLLIHYFMCWGTVRANIGAGIGRCRVRVQFVVTYKLHLSQLHCALSELVFNSGVSVCKWEVTVDSPVLSHWGHWHFKEAFTSEKMKHISFYWVCFIKKKSLYNDAEREFELKCSSCHSFHFTGVKLKMEEAVCTSCLFVCVPQSMKDWYTKQISVRFSC